MSVAAEMPKMQRFLVVSVYVLASLLLTCIVANALLVDGGPCLAFGLWIIGLFGLWLGTSVALVVLGWRGRLWGCQARRLD